MSDKTYYEFYFDSVCQKCGTPIKLGSSLIETDEIKKPKDQYCPCGGKLKVADSCTQYKYEGKKKPIKKVVNGFTN